MTQGAITRVMIVNDRTVTRAGYESLFDKYVDFEITEGARDLENAIAGMTAAEPDVVVVDLPPHSFDVVETVRCLVSAAKSGIAPVLVLIDQLDERVHGLLRVGARGLLLSQASPAEIIAAVRLVAAGYTLALPTIAGAGIDQAVAAPDGCHEEPGAFCLEHLTRREADVLRLIARGLSNAEISAALFVSESTVKSHVQRLLGKLKLRNRVHAVIYAYQAGLVRSEAQLVQADS